MGYSFFASIDRMKYIARWSLMRNSREENLSEHSLEVAMIAHALCSIGNVRFQKDLDAGKAALIGLYHDASEILTGDMPTPVKYQNQDLQEAYKEVERAAEERLLLRLPEDLRPVYREIFFGLGEGACREGERENDAYMRSLVKAADKLSAYLKCVEEENAGNTEFRTAKQTIWASLMEMRGALPELAAFLDDFLEGYGKTLDELNQ